MRYGKRGYNSSVPKGKRARLVPGLAQPRGMRLQPGALVQTTVDAVSIPRTVIFHYNLSRYVRNGYVPLKILGMERIGRLGQRLQVLSDTD